MTDPVSRQLGEFNTELLDTLGNLNALIDNRGAWNDGIEGCREAVALLRGLQGRLHEALEDAQKLESDLHLAREGNTRWEGMYSDLASSDRGLRTEYDKLKKIHADMLINMREQLEDYQRKCEAFEKRVASLTNVRLLAAEMLRELT